MDILSLLLSAFELMSPMEALFISILFIASSLYAFQFLFTKIRNTLRAESVGDFRPSGISKIEISPSAMRKRELLGFLSRNDITKRERDIAEKRLATFKLEPWQI